MPMDNNRIVKTVSKLIYWSRIYPVTDQLFYNVGLVPIGRTEVCYISNLTFTKNLSALVDAGVLLNDTEYFTLVCYAVDSKSFFYNAYKDVNPLANFYYKGVSPPTVASLNDLSLDSSYIDVHGSDGLPDILLGVRMDSVLLAARAPWTGYFDTEESFTKLFQVSTRDSSIMNYEVKVNTQYDSLIFVPLRSHQRASDNEFFVGEVNFKLQIGD